MPLSRILGTLAVGLAVQFSPNSAWAGQYNFTRIADTSGEFSEFGFFAINDSGTVAFQATLAGASEGGGIYTGSGGAITTIADGNDFLPHVFGQFPAINNSGTVAFIAQPYNGGSGIYTGDGGAISTAVFTDGPFLLLYEPSINDSGTVAFRGMLDNGARGIYSASGSVTTTIADDGAEFQSFGSYVSINGLGVVAFQASPDMGVTRIYTGSGGATTTIVESGGLFSSLNANAAPSINDSGTVAFLGELTGGGQAIYSGSGGSLTLIADTFGAYSALGAPIINNSGSVFFGVLTNAGALEFYVDSARVIGTGDALDGSTVTNLNYFGDVLSNTGSVAFFAELADGRTGIYVAAATAAVPEPSSVLLLSAGFGGLLAFAHRFRGKTGRPDRD